MHLVYDLDVLEGVDATLRPLSSFNKPFVKDIGVPLYSGFKMDKQILMQCFKIAFFSSDCS